MTASRRSVKAAEKLLKRIPPDAGWTLDSLASVIDEFAGIPGLEAEVSELRREVLSLQSEIDAEDEIVVEDSE